MVDRVRTIVFLAAAAMLLSIMGVVAAPRAHGWQRTGGASDASSSGPLFTPGEGSVGAASALDSRAPAPGIDAAVQRGWSGSSLLGFDASPTIGRTGPGAGQGNSDALLGTEFEGIGDPPPRRPSPSTSPAGAASREVAAQGKNAQAGRPVSESGASQPTGGAAIPAEPDPDSIDERALRGDCGWLGLGCMSSSMWTVIGGLSLAGVALAALIVRELYFVR